MAEYSGFIMGAALGGEEWIPEQHPANRATAMPQGRERCVFAAGHTITKPPQVMPITDLMGETKHSTPTPPHYLCCRWGLQVTDSEMDPEGWPLWKSWKRDQLGRAEVH